MAAPRNQELESKLFGLFQSEKLRSKDDLLTLFCKHLGFDYAETSLPSRSEEYWGDGQVAELVGKESFEILAKAGDARLGGSAVIYGTLRDFNLSSQRAIILQLRKVFPDALYVFAKPQTLGRAEGAQLNIVHARLRASGDEATPATRLILRRFRFGPGERYRTAAERLAKLDLSTLKSRSSAAITALCNEAFDKEALTKEFFKKLDQHIKNIESDLREHQHLSGPEAFSEAQLLIERLIFLCFAQNRGWLDQKSTYLLNHFAPYRKDADGFGYYHEFLHRLFRTLAEPPPAPGDRLPGVPFLNGGLFDDDEFKVPSSKLRIRNAVFADLFDNLLEAYNFTVREDTPLSQEVAVDPEMLGKIFESIVLHAEQAGEEYQAPDKRKATGSYYTPRIVVHFICRESLRLYFAQRAGSLADPAQRGTWKERVSHLFKEIDPTDGFSEDELKTLKRLLSPTEAKRSLDLLRTMRTLDPAVGSGAFPVGLLHELICLQRILEIVAHGYRDPVSVSGTQWVQNAKEHFIQHSLFGVDIQQQAIEICRLRLWLSLLVDYELGVNPFEAERAEFIKAINKISQLPNLEMNFKRGDSLHDYVCDHPVRIEPQKPSEYAAELERIEKLGARLHKTTRGDTKKKLRLEILEKRIALARRIVENEIAALKEGYIASNWFGETLSDREESERREREIARLQTALKQLEHDEVNLRRLEQRQLDKDFYRKLRELEGSEMDGPLNFAWRIDFPHVLSGAPAVTLRDEFALVNEAQGQQELTVAHSPKSDAGFDLIVGNPPFVTARDPKKRELYRERWPLVCYREYELVAPFFQLGFDLLSDNGELGFITSNGFTMRDFGKPLVEQFLPSIHLQKIVDCDGLSFPGHGTPTCIVFGRRPIRAETREAIKAHPVVVAGRLPGGGDLRTAPEESPLWFSLSQHHDEPCYQDSRISVAARTMTDLAKWPMKFETTGQPTRQAIERRTSALDDFIEGCGSMFDTHKDEAFVLSGDVARRAVIEMKSLMPFAPGDHFRNWLMFDGQFVLRPYDEHWKLLSEDKDSGLFKWLRMFKRDLGGRATFGGDTYEQAGEPWFRYHQMSVAKITAGLTLAYPEIATHAHFFALKSGCLLPQTAPIIQLSNDDENDACLLAGLLNASAALFWLKQVSFNKGAGKDEQLDRFEYQGKRIKQIPIPAQIADGLRGRGNALADALISLSRACWERGRELMSLALRKLFEKSGETYHAWNAALPGHIAAHAKLGAPFSSAAELRDRFARVQSIRERLRAEMIARQEEMDWLVYAAYGLIATDDPAVQVEMEPAPLGQAQRPFHLWQTAEGDFARAVKLIPADWPELRHVLWESRLAAIRDDEHIRRIEQPVYKRRWDEQWKVGNRWMAGPVAYAQEFIDAFTWWLSEKAEWHLEHKAHGGPIALQDWSATLFKDARVAGAWEVAADAVLKVAKFKFDALDPEKRETRQAPQRDDCYTAFERFFGDAVLNQSVPHGMPPAVPWDQLAANKKWTSAQLKKAQAVRGKLNVPRERFQQMSPMHFVRVGNASPKWARPS